MKAKPKERRRIKLIKPNIQLRLIGLFVGLSSLGFLMQSLHVGLRLSELAGNIPEGGNYLMAVLPALPIEILLFSFGMLLPLTIALGIVVTFRIAGPIYRFEQYLKQVARGEAVGPCKLRSGDQLQELCDLINEVTEPIRASRAQTTEHEEAPLREAG